MFPEDRQGLGVAPARHPASAPPPAPGDGSRHTQTRAVRGAHRQGQARCCPEAPERGPRLDARDPGGRRSVGCSHVRPAGACADTRLGGGAGRAGNSQVPVASPECSRGRRSPTVTSRVEGRSFRNQPPSPRGQRRPDPGSGPTQRGRLGGNQLRGVCLRRRPGHPRQPCAPRGRASRGPPGVSAVRRQWAQRSGGL